MTLGDLGADVLKVERTRSGDETRGWGPPFDSRGESAYFLSVNRNKLSIALDLALEADRAVLLALIAQSDAVFDNFRPGTLEKWRIDVSDLLARHPRLVWCTITGFGPTSGRPGYDFVIQAESGWMAITGEPTGEPMKVGVALADVIAGKDAAIGVLAALAGRHTGGPAGGRRLFVSLAASATASLVNVAQNVLVTGRPARRWGNAHANLVPYQLFHAADRALVIAVGSDAQWRACAESLGLDALAADAQLATNAGRLAQRDRVVSAIAARVREAPAAHWLDALGRAGVPAGTVRSVEEALADVVASPLTGVAPAAPQAVRLPPPRIDEHGSLVRAHGWDAFRHLESAGT